MLLFIDLQLWQLPLGVTMLTRLVVLSLAAIPVIGAEEGTQALLYLSKYGYIEPGNGTQALLSEDAIREYVKGAVKDFQAFAGLNQTGELDSLTVELMNTPRCGVWNGSYSDSVFP